MMVMLERRPTPWAVRCASSHCSVLILSGQMRARTSSSRISAAVPGSVLRPASLSRVRYSARGTSERRAPSVTSRAVKPWMWMSVRAGPHRLEHVEVVVAVEVGVDAALQADLGGALGFGLGHPAGDLVELQQVGRPAQVERERPLGEGAEAALERADVGVVDVAVAHEGHVVADDAAAAGRRPPRPPGAPRGPRAREQRDDLGLAHLLAQRHAGQHLGHGATAGRRRPPGAATGAATSASSSRRRRRLAPRAPRGVAGQALGVGARRARGSAVPGRASASGSRAKLGVDGQARRQRVAGRLGGLRAGCRGPARPARGSRGRP